MEQTFNLTPSCFQVRFYGTAERLKRGSSKSTMRVQPASRRPYILIAVDSALAAGGIGRGISRLRRSVRMLVLRYLLS
jgi:hypothetical protein